MFNSNSFNQNSNSYLLISLISQGNANNDDYAQYLFDNPSEVFSPNINEISNKIATPIEKEIPEISNITQKVEINKSFEDINDTKSNNFLNNPKFPFLGIKGDEMIYLDDEVSKKSTGDKSENKNNNIKKAIFDVKSLKKYELRVDYAIKNIKVYISKYIKEYGNKLIKDYNFNNKLKKIKLFLPSYRYFTGNANEKQNKTFLNLSVEEILTYPKEKIKDQIHDNRLQRQNQKIINTLKEYIEIKYEDEKDEKYRKLLDFFRMSYEEIIIDFYKSEKFKEYSSCQKTKELDKQFQKTKGFSLLENNAFIKLLKK